MARYTGPKVKISRREGADIFDSPKWNKRNFPPGQHGPKKTRGTKSDYGKQLREKQKARLMYGLMEKQFANTFLKAQKLEGDLGENLLVLLESRLDNVIYRAGLANTRRLARQLVNHGHIEVNGRKNDIPSYLVKVDDTISIKQNKLKTKYWEKRKEEISKKKPGVPSWLNLDTSGLTIKVTARPKRDEMPLNIETTLIVEFYSR